MNKEEYNGLKDGDMIENMETGKRYVVRVESTETFPKLRLINYHEEFKVVSKIVRKDNLE